MTTNVTVNNETDTVSISETGTQGPAGLLWRNAPWEVGNQYIVNDAIRRYGSSFRVVQAHTAAADNEPGIGVNWRDFWEYIAQGADLLLPDMFDAVRDDDYHDNWDALSEGISLSASLGRPFVFDGIYAIGQRLDIPPDAIVLSRRTAALVPVSGSGLAEGVRMLPGISLGRTELPMLSMFTGTALDIQSSFSDIHIDYINFADTAVRFSTPDGDTVSSNMHFNTIADCGRAVDFNTDTVSRVIEGCGLASGFFISRTPSIARFSGAVGVNDGLYVNSDSVDIQAGYGGETLFENLTGGNVARFDFICRRWFGGDGFDDASPPVFFDPALSNFINGEMDIKDARLFDQRHLVPGKAFGTRWNFSQQFPRSLAFELAATNDLPSFNGGTMLYYTNFSVKITLAAPLNAGASLLRYFWHILGDGAYPQWKITPTGGTVGVGIDFIRDDSLTAPGRIAVQIRNNTASPINTGAVMHFTIERA